MPRFIAIADTHVGATADDYHQQPAYPGRIERIASALDEWIVREGGVEFVLHLGDMVHRATEENVRDAAAIFRLCVPVYLCLGNHDMTAPDAPAMWRSLAPGLFAGGAFEFDLSAGLWTVHVVPTHWCERPYYWEEKQTPWLARAPVDRLLAAGDPTGAGRILVTHSPVMPAPVEQTGFDAPWHGAPEPFVRQLLDLRAAMPDLRCVVSAHNHVNLRVERDGVQYVTASAFDEAPFEFKLFEADGARLKMSTVTLGRKVGFPWDYDFGRTYVQGRARDRAFEIVA